LSCYLIAGFSRQTGAFQVQLISQVLHAVIGLGDGGGGKGIGFNDIRARFQIVDMDLADGVRHCQAEKVIVALDVRRPVLETLAAIGCLVQFEQLDFSPHGSVQHQNAGFGDLLKAREGVRLGHGDFLPLGHDPGLRPGRLIFDIAAADLLRAAVFQTREVPVQDRDSRYTNAAPDLIRGPHISNSCGSGSRPGWQREDLL
jgi:hypothetical protein